MSLAAVETCWLELSRRIEKRRELFETIFSAVCDDVSISMENRNKIKIFFQSANPEVPKLFLGWIIKNEYLEYFMEELQLNLPWEMVVLIIPIMDPDEEHELMRYLK